MSESFRQLLGTGLGWKDGEVLGGAFASTGYFFFCKFLFIYWLREGFLSLRRAGATL